MCLSVYAALMSSVAPVPSAKKKLIYSPVHHIIYLHTHTMDLLDLIVFKKEKEPNNSAQKTIK